MITVDVGDESALLIVKHPTGVQYSIQCGGMACYHRTVEGFVLETFGSHMIDNLSMESWGSLSPEQKQQVCDSIVEINEGYYGLTLVPNGEMLEAFVEVRVKIWDDVEYDAVLTWENCD